MNGCKILLLNLKKLIVLVRHVLQCNDPIIVNTDSPDDPMNPCTVF